MTSALYKIKGGEAYEKIVCPFVKGIPNIMSYVLQSAIGYIELPPRPLRLQRSLMDSYIELPPRPPIKTKK